MPSELSKPERFQKAWRRLHDSLRKAAAKQDSRLMRAWRIALRILLASYLLFCAVFLSVRYLVLPQVGQYKPDVEKMLTEGFGRQVTISRMDASWYGFSPLLRLDGVYVHDPEGNVALQLPEVSVTVSWRSLFVFDLRLSQLAFNRPELDIRRDAGGQLYVAGLPVDTSTRKKGGGMDWVLNQDAIVIRDATLRWRDETRDAPELVLENLNFALENSGRRHRMRFLAQTGITGSGQIDVRADFVHPFFAERISDTSTWKGSLYVALPTADLEPWKAYVDLPYGLKKGAGSVNAWISLDHARVADLTVDVNLENVALRLEPDLPELDLTRISGRITAKEIFDAASGDDGLSLGERPHAIELLDIDLETADGIRMVSVDFSERHTPASGTRPASTEIRADELDLATLIELTKYLPVSAEQRRMLDDFSPSGQLNHFSLGWEGSYPDLVSYQLNGKFAGLSMNAVPPRSARPKTASSPAQAAIPGIPGFRNLTGGISANQHGGSLTLDSDAASLNLPSYFPRAEWHFDAFRLEADWSQSAGNEFVFSIRNMDFSLDGIDAQVSGKYVRAASAGTEAPGSVDMTAKVRSIDMKKARNYVPLQTKEVLRFWLSNAFHEGTASDIVVQLKGDLSKFPFTDAMEGDPKGEFSVRMNVSDVTLNYAPTETSKDGKLLWEPIEKINGWLTIRGGEIVIHADTAVLSGTRLSDVDVVIPDMLAQDSFLNITGNAAGEMKDFIRFVNTSPVNAIVGGLTEESKTGGNASLLLKMQMPLSRMADSKVQGTLTFDGNDIHLFEDLPLLSGVQGKVHFSEKGFDLEGITARFLGGNASIGGGTEKNGRFVIRANGTLTADGLRRTYTGGSAGKLMARLSGEMPYTVSITERPGAGYPDILIESGMLGFGIDLPSPLGKRAGETRQLKVTAGTLPPAGRAKRDELRISYGQAAAAHYQRQKTDRNWLLTRGGMAINMKPALQPGLSLNLSMKTLDMNLWQEALSSLLADDGQKKGAAAAGPNIGQYVEPQHFFIQVDELLAMEFRLTKAKITGTRQATRWQADVDANELKGRLQWAEPTGKQAEGKLTARLSSFSLARTTTGPEKIEDVIKRDSVRQIPAMDLVVENFTLFDIGLGRTELVATNVPVPAGREWRISRLSISNADAKFLSAGNWLVDKSGAHRTTMDYSLDIHNAGRLLDRFGYKGILSGGKGRMKGNISWSGLPYSLDIPSLSGKIELDVGKGQFLKVEPGMAKLLGVLSMQSLPRRLRLDFRDVFSEGFAFDEITALAEITGGVAKTENLSMRGVTATVLMDGSVDIAKETQNLHVAVLPEINAGAASLVYSLINPAIGVGTFLAQLLLKDPLSRTFTYEYQITGSWTEPNIEKLENRESRAQRFMNSIKPTAKDEI